MLKLIAIVEQNFGLSLNGTIPWESTEDRYLFNQLTENSTVIMGRNTFFSHKNFPLKNRKNIVITKINIPNVSCFPHIEDAIKQEPNAWIIGGSQIYNYSLQKNLIDIAVISQVRFSHKADTFLNNDYLYNFKCLKVFAFHYFDVKILKKQ